MSDGDESDAYFDLVEAEVGRAVVSHGVYRAVLELTEVRAHLATRRIQAHSATRRGALSEGISAIDARLRALRTELEGLG